MDAEDRETWERAAILLETTQADELLDPNVPAETLLYRLYHEDGVVVFKPSPLRAACACNKEKIAAVLDRYSPDDLADMVEDGFIRVSCDFCRKEYLFDAAGRPAEVP
jgi:molecular chaperone Hsp33